MKKEIESERRVTAQWLVDKATLDNPKVRKSLLKDNEGFFVEDEYLNKATMTILKIKNPYNYLKWVKEENEKLKKIYDKVFASPSTREIQDYNII